MNRVVVMILAASAAAGGVVFVAVGADCDDRYPASCGRSATPTRAAQAATALEEAPVRRHSRRYRQAARRHAAAPAPPPVQPSQTIKDPRAPLHLPEPNPRPDPPLYHVSEDARLALAHEAFQAVAVDQTTLVAFFQIAPNPVKTLAFASPAEAAPVIKVEVEPAPPPIWPQNIYEPPRRAANDDAFGRVIVPSKRPSMADWLLEYADIIAGAMVGILSAWPIYLIHRVGGWSRAASGVVSILLGLWSIMNVWKHIRNWINARRARKSASDRNQRHAGSDGKGTDESRLSGQQVWPIGKWRAEEPRYTDGHGPMGLAVPNDSAIGAWSRTVQAVEPSATNAGEERAGRHGGFGGTHSQGADRDAAPGWLSRR